ncbi:unknown protein [Seminavis robusta]|uniref:Uncharacterized protein n=1 Tax=Seminavis robusta TaxID=568900 RepID=A0A9N8H9J6_9STRA|nr:unknown protein [Seminavis robusta]|eukprot:Sro119_g058170.1 n/a (251) ;mRNA; f:77260-78012
MGAVFDEADYLPMESAGLHFVMFSKHPNNSAADVSQANIKQAITEMLLCSHPDKVAKHVDDYRVHYASLAVTSLLNHMSAWIKTTNINASSANTGVDVLEMPPMLITNFEPTKPICSLPSHFEMLASSQFAAASKPSSKNHRRNLERARELAENARYAETIYWERANPDPVRLCKSNLTYIPKPGTSDIPDISDTGAFFSSFPVPAVPEQEKMVREVIRRLKTNDKMLYQIDLDNQDLQAHDNLSRVVEA